MANSRVYSKRLREEYSRAKGSYKIELVEDKISNWKVELDVIGYGTVDIYITFPANYPFSPPGVKIPRVLHPNIYKNGSLCMSILHQGNHQVGDIEGLELKWTASIWMTSLLESAVSILMEPNLDSPADVDAKILYSSNYNEYVEKNADLARMRSNEKVKRDQDKAFEEVSRIDQNLAEGRKLADKLEEQKKKSGIEAEKNRAKEIDTASLELSAEPDEDCGEEVVSIRFRTPESVIVRRFFASAQLSEVLLFLGSRGISQSDDFKLLSAWPKEDLRKVDPGVSLLSLGLNQQTLTVEMNS